MVAGAIIKEPNVVAVLRCCPCREKLAVRKKLTRVAVRKRIKTLLVKPLLELMNHYLVVAISKKIVKMITRYPLLVTRYAVVLQQLSLC